MYVSPMNSFHLARTGMEERSRAHQDDTANTDYATWSTAPAIINDEHEHNSSR